MLLSQSHYIRSAVSSFASSKKIHWKQFLFDGFVAYSAYFNSIFAAMNSNSDPVTALILNWIAGWIKYRRILKISAISSAYQQISSPTNINVKNNDCPNNPCSGFMNCGKIDRKTIRVWIFNMLEVKPLEKDVKFVSASTSSAIFDFWLLLLLCSW